MMIDVGARAGDRRFVVVSGLPGSGKTTVARALGALLNLPVLDKDDILERLFESRGVGDAAWRRQLSREADAILQSEALASAGAIVTSFWRVAGMPPDSGTPTGWLASLPGAIVNVHCACPPAVAADRFVGRSRHEGHLDGTRTVADIRSSIEALPRDPISLHGSRVTVDTTRDFDAEAVRRAVEAGWSVCLDEAQAASIVRAQFPDLSPDTVIYLGEGYDSCAFEVNGEWVFRFPKRAEVERQLAVESRMLPVLAERSPLPLPLFSFHGRPSAAYPYRFAGYRKLPGEPAIRFDERTIRATDGVRAVGRFLSWLHRFPVRDAAACGVEPRDAGELIDEVRADALDDLDRLPAVLDAAPIDEWRAFLTAGCPPSPVTPAVLVHGDLASEHVLYDSGRQQVTGIIDWSDMALSDPAIDFTAFWHWGGRPCLEAALAVYENPIDDALVARARFLAACRGVADIVFGVEMQRQEYVEAGARALVMCLGGDAR